ncbi:hypothetical protein [Halorhabdus amylolytica]|uniref:hypothetical protein n=1 Tax=Halorhabdus amylolytica TaxID=2559573 RepID=UPI0010A9D573|nr:hypothetical protein [Halorhabdus amylolytica]
MAEDSDDSDEQYPAVPRDDLAAGGWTLRDRRQEVRAEVAGFTVRAFERRYEDDALRADIREAGGPDHLWRLFYATQLSFTPPLPPVFGPAMALPKVRAAAREEFAEQLREEGLVDVEEGEDERFEVASGTRAKLTRYDAVLPVETGGDEREVPMEGWIASWHDGAMLLAGGLYPAVGLADMLDVPNIVYEPDASREELRSLIRGVEY